MKRLFALLLLATPLWAGTTTTNVGLYVPANGESNWGTKAGNNFTILDSSVVTKTGSNAFTGYASFASSVSFSSSTFNRVWIATPTYTISGDQLAVNGIERIGGSGGTLYLCDSNFQNCSTLNSVGLTVNAITANGILTTNAPSGLIIANGGQVSGGSFSVNGSNGITFADLSGLRGITLLSSQTVPLNYAMVLPSAQASTGTVLMNDGFGNLSFPTYLRISTATTTTSLFSVLIGTSAPNSSTDYHVAVSTSGALGMRNLPAASIRATKPNRVGEYFYCTDCATVSTCVSTGTLATQWAIITNKGTICN